MPRLGTLEAIACVASLAASALAQEQFALTARLHFPSDDAVVQQSSLVDLDGDGDLDVIGTANAAYPVRAYENDGLGRFVADSRFTPFQLATPHVVGDFDGDGDQDVLLRGVLLRNRGPLGLETVPINIVDSPLQVGDVNGDGLADVLTASRNSMYPLPDTTTITLWLASAGPVFAPTPVLTIAQTLGHAAFADFDGDGDLDLLLGTYPNGVFTPYYVPGIERILRNNGAGQFTENAAWLPTPNDDNTLAMAVADFDTDGDVDCAFCSYPLFGPLAWSFRSNDGSGQLLPWDAPFVPALNSVLQQFQIADLDRDGDPDFVRLGEWYRNDGQGNFEQQPLHDCPRWPSSRLDGIGDVDGDGDLDLVCVVGGIASGSAYRLLLDQGGMKFIDATARAWEPLSARSIHGDVDGDGDVDLLPLGGPLCRNDGSGRFTGELFPWAGTPGVTQHGFGDFDRDGDLDVVYFFLQPTIELRLGLNDGTGRFLDPAPAIAPAVVTAWPAASAVFDADGDGYPDLVFGTDGVGLQLLRNDGALGFAADPQHLAAFPDYFRVIVAGDFDRDGDLDLLTGHQNWGVNSPALHMLVNDGTGRFTDTPSRLVYGSAPVVHSIDAFDADADGDLDVLIGNFASSSYDHRHRFLRNDGTGRLVEHSSLPAMRSHNRATVGDCDGDGDLDIVATTYSSGLRYWRNNGQGLFTDVGGISMWIWEPKLDLVDLDGDGDADLIVGDRVLHNRQWDASAPFLPQIGRSYTLEFGGIDVPSGIAIPVFSVTPAHVPIPPFGTLGIDLATGITMRLTAINNGLATYAMSIPANAGMLGFRFGVQAALVGGGRAHLTPPVYDVIRN